MKVTGMNNIRVLIVEDDPMVADINKKYTEAVEGFTVVGIVRRGDEALAQIDRINPDVVILDNYLPERNGVEILGALRREDWPVDVIMITAADDTPTVSKALRHGVVAYITKPFKFERYKAVLEAYRNFRLTASKKRTLDQEEIDALSAIGVAKAEPEQHEMPKNYNPQTRDLILNFLIKQDQPQSAEEVAATTGISRVTARRYLEYLVEQGQVERTLDYLAVGRPIHRFRLKKNLAKRD